MRFILAGALEKADKTEALTVIWDNSEDFRSDARPWNKKAQEHDKQLRTLIEHQQMLGFEAIQGDKLVCRDGTNTPKESILMNPRFLQNSVDKYCPEICIPVESLISLWTHEETVPLSGVIELDVE